jgi:hypothetical protein
MFVTLLAMLVEVVELVWETAPLSPGLKSRIEMLVLQVVHGGGEWAVGSQFHRQSQIQVVPVPEGVVADVDCPAESPQPHVHVQTHVRPGSADGSTSDSRSDAAD